LGVLSAKEAALNQRALASPSLLAWQPEDKPPAKNICVGGGKLTFPPLSPFLETVATVKYSKTEAGIE
jgi:hypothetical protein